MQISFTIPSLPRSVNTPERIGGTRSQIRDLTRHVVGACAQKLSRLVGRLVGRSLASQLFLYIAVT